MMGPHRRYRDTHMRMTKFAKLQMTHKVSIKDQQLVQSMYRELSILEI